MVSSSGLGTCVLTLFLPHEANPQRGANQPATVRDIRETVRV